MKRGFLIVLLMGVLSTVMSQNKEVPKITKEHLLEQGDDVFLDTPAKIVYRDIVFEYGRVLKVSEAIKIYNVDGLDYSNFDIPYDDVEILKANTYNLENNEIAITEVNEESILRKEVSKDDTDIIIPFPNVKEGSIIEISYIVRDIGMWAIYYQSSLPIEHFHLSFSNPSSVKLTLTRNWFSPIELEVSRKGGLLHYTGKNIPALIDEGLLGSYNNYRGRLFIEALVRYRQELKDWGDIAKYFQTQGWDNNNDWRRGYTFSDLLNNGNYFDVTVKQIIGNEVDPLKKSQLIYQFVRNRMEWNDYLIDFSKNTKQIYRNKIGSSGAINMLLITLLREAGIDARVMMVASKNKGFIHFVTKKLFNNLVVYVNINGKDYFLDASRKNGSFGVLPIYFVNGDGLVLYEGENYRLISTQANKKSVGSYVIDASLSPDNLAVMGGVKKRLSDYYAWEFRVDYKETLEKGYEEALEDSYESLAISNMVIKEMTNPDKPISLYYNFETKEAVEEIDNDIYLDPLLHFGLEENYFKQENRLYPIDFGFPLSRKVVLNFKIPNGYTVKSMPTKVAVSTPDDLATFSFDCTSNESQIKVSLNLNINQGIIPVEYYQSIKELFSKYTEVSNSKIVLTKS